MWTTCSLLSKCLELCGQCHTTREITLVLKTDRAVATHFISLFVLAEVHFKKHTFNVSVLPRVQVLGGGWTCWHNGQGRQADGSAAHQHPPFVAGYICCAPSQHNIMLTAYLYANLKVWGIFSLCYCLTICRHLSHSCCVCIHWGGNRELNHNYIPATGSLLQWWQKFIYVIVRSSSVLIYHTWPSSEIPKHMLPKCCPINKVTNKAFIFIILLGQFFSEIIS